MPQNVSSFLRYWMGALVFLCVGVGALMAQSAAGKPPESAAVIVELEGLVEVSRAGSPLWDPARPSQPLLPRDRVRTADRARAVIRLSDQTTLRQGPLTILEIPEQTRRGIRLLKGLLYYFHRDRPRDFPVITPACHAAIIGTEFTMMVAEDGTTTLQLLDGEVEMTNEFGQVRLGSGEAALASPRDAPMRTAALEAMNAVQWCLYYPGVLHLGEIPLSAEDRGVLGESLRAYNGGDLLAALKEYPADRRPGSDSERVYLAGLLLAVGKVEEAENLLAVRSASNVQLSTNRAARLAGALRTVIEAVKLRRGGRERGLGRASTIKLASEWLADSYHHQAQSDLESALAAARNATEVAPEFGFAWARVAELEFSFGRTEAARFALEKGLALSPRNAQAHALNGFLLAAANRIETALSSFEQAMALDGALGNAWLGRGLCRIRGGDIEAGVQDLQVATTVEPQRAALRSYLGKAFAHRDRITGPSEKWSPREITCPLAVQRRTILERISRGVMTGAYLTGLADRELEIAKRLDPNDPTPWLYSALLNQERNRINEAIRDLENSQALNDNRAVYRSRLLLDEDRAVRGANLATIYEDAGMVDVSVWEAARAANTDYANYSAHLFLANSYNALRDSRQVNLRYETPAVSEFLIGNLLAPVGAGILSPNVTQGEYARLFERDRLGFVSSTEYLSRGDWLQTASQFGIFGNFSYALDASYRSENGQRANNDFRELITSLALKQQITPRDSVYLQAGYYDAEGGDVNRYYDLAQANRGLRIEESQEPFLVGGYHREWRPGMHTLFLAGRIQDRYRVDNPRQETLLLAQPGFALPFSIEQQYESASEVYTAELQQIVQTPSQTWIMGGRYQSGHFDTENQHANASVDHPLSFLLEPQLNALPRESVDPEFERASAYSYLQLRPLAAWDAADLVLIAGATYDHLQYPANHRYAPLSSQEQSTSRVSPKAGFIWTPLAGTTVRAAYTRALGGVSLDQSVQLEPTQIAGFLQTYRSLIPESVEGANAAPTFESWGVSVEQKLNSGTYLGVSAELLRSKVDRIIGTFDAANLAVAPSQSVKELEYDERNLTFTANQLIGKEWSIGGRYRISQADLEGEFAQIPVNAELLHGFQRASDEESLLQEATLFALFNHPSGVFAQAQALWTRQDNAGLPPHIGDEDFWHLNFFAGYRLPRRRAEFTLGLLNIAGEDYRLHPLNLTAELPRERTLLARLRFYF